MRNDEIYGETEERFMDVMGGPARDAIVDKALETEGLFRKSAVEREQRFRNPENDELTEDELMNAMSGPAKDAIVDKALETEGLFRESALERERMLRELNEEYNKDVPSSFRR